MIDRLVIILVPPLLYIARRMVVWGKYKRQGAVVPCRNFPIKGLSGLSLKDSKDPDAWRILLYSVLSYFYVTQGNGVSTIAFVGLIFYFVGWLVASWGRVSLGVSWADIMEETISPMPLVNSGAYRYSRNPIYLGLSIISVAEGVIFSSDLHNRLIGENLTIIGILYGLSYVLYWVSVYYLLRDYHHEAIAEEYILQRRYGTHYLRYLECVPRYLLSTPKRSAAKDIAT
ncbi:MAG: isoprenylcysteine carboxylmethyltransferase family protein [Candidatus Veblenbacteria bacterium]|nr:isoprenylcysteine carboxylmethyltransferase family protein [Candidatus Veblenbacteria bacterium]